MELRGHVGALSSAASFGCTLPTVHSTRQRRAAAAKEQHRNLRAAVQRAPTPAEEGLNRTPQNRDLPSVLPKNQKKPWVTPPKRGGFLRKLKRGPPKLRRLSAPGNGLLIPRLIPVAHQVFEAHNSLPGLVSRLMQVTQVHVCKSCGETHVGRVGHGIATCTGARAALRRSRHLWTKASTADVIPSLETYHLYDRLKTITHVHRFGVERLPAIAELCIQAGVELPEYPTLRRTRPVKAIGRKLVEEDTSLFEFDDLDKLFSYVNTKEGSDVEDEDDGESNESDEEASTEGEEDGLGSDTENHHEEDLEPENSGRAVTVSRLLETDVDMASLTKEEVANVAQMTLETWEAMRNGTKMLMAKYIVKVCGYCPEIHIGPRGHKVKVCGAFKHQWRAGQHGWQKATIDDLIPPKYVWHVQDQEAPHLDNRLRRYYGQAPAVVELCVQAGAAVPDEYRPMMRMDVVVPDVDEVYNVV